jgi:hypothetical protein
MAAATRIENIFFISEPLWNDKTRLRRDHSVEPCPVPSRTCRRPMVAASRVVGSDWKAAVLGALPAIFADHLDLNNAQPMPNGKCDLVEVFAESLRSRGG